MHLPPSFDQPTFAEVFEEDLLICTEGNAGHHNRAFHRTNLVGPYGMDEFLIKGDKGVHPKKGVLFVYFL